MSAGRVNGRTTGESRQPAAPRFAFLLLLIAAMALGSGAPRLEGVPFPEGAAGKSEFGRAGVADDLSLNAAAVLEVREEPARSGDRRSRVKVLQTSFKYPWIRVEEMLAGAGDDSDETVIERKAAVADHVIVKLKPGAPVAMLEAIEPGSGMVVRKELARDLYVLGIEGHGLDAVPRAIEALSSASDLVEYAEPDYLLRIFGNDPRDGDPRLREQWGLFDATHEHAGPAGPAGPAAGIDALGAWSLTTGRRGVLVGVLDTGVDYRHPDLAANVWINQGEIPGNAVDDDGNGFVDDVRGWDFLNDDGDPADDHGHGTHVAGIIGAVGNNGRGVSGVCWKASLVPLKFLDKDGTGAVSDAVRAVRYATRIGAQVASASWGGAAFSRALKEAIDDAGRARMLVVAAAGNTGRDNDVSSTYPASYDSANVIAVAAADRGGRLARFSNFGPLSVDVAAPGVNVLSTVPGGDYRIASGTSVAAAHVAGVAALVRSRYRDLDVEQAKRRVLRADRRPGLKGRVLTDGALNAFAAVSNAAANDAAGGGAEAGPERRALAAAAPVALNANLAAAAPLSWSSDAFEEFVFRSGYGQVAKNWSPWFVDATPGNPGAREWNIVPGESGWGQELRKSNVRLGLHRSNSGFTPGGAYLIKLRAKWLSGTQAAPLCSLGIHPTGGTNPNEVTWASGVQVASRTGWTEVSGRLTVPNASATVFIKVDLAGRNDYGVAIDNLSIQPDGSGNQPPAVSLSTDKTAAIAPGSFVLSAGASDADGTVSRVEFFQGSTLLGSDTASPYSFAWSGVGVGAYGLTARAYDNAGAVSVSNTVTVTVTSSNNQAPTVSLTSDKTTAAAPGTFVLTAAASDPDGSISRVEFLSGSTVLNTDTASPYSFTWSGVGAGSYSLTARAYDNANASAASGAVAVTVTPASPSGKSKLTIHAGWGGHSEYFIKNAKPRVVKIFDEVKNAAAIKQMSPGTLVIGRIFPGSVPDGVLNNGSPVDRANDWWNTVKATVLAYPDVDYWEGLNEPVVTSAQAMTWYAQYEIARVNILAANGRKACIANFATGNPDIALWPQFVPAIDHAIANGGIMGLHEYGTPMTQYWEEPVQEGWLCGRYRKVYRQHLQGREIPLVITEAGIDEGTLASTGPGQPKPRPDAQANHGWQQALGNPPVPGFPQPGDLVARKPWYLNQLKWYDSILKQDSYVLGATIYQVEIPGWGSFAIGPIIQELTDYVAQGGTNAAPAVSLSSDRTSATAPGSFVLTASASDTDGTISKVEFYQGATLLNTDSTSPYSYTWSGVGAGSYSLSAKAYDNAGAAAFSVAVAVTVNASGNQPPAVGLSTDKTTAEAPGSFVLTASASDADGTISKVEFYQGATLLNTDTTSPYTYTWSGVAVGSHSLTARAHDNAGASATSSAVVVSVTGVAPSGADPGVVWLSDDMDTHNGELVKRWSKWSSGAGSTEWFIVPGEGGWWAQEVRKTNANVGVSRPNRGFKPGDTYRLKFRARRTSGTGAPKCHAGVQPAGGSLSWGQPVTVTSTTSWVDVSYDFIASSWNTTLFLRADLTGLSDLGVAFDNVSVELLSPRSPEPWMSTGAPPVEPLNIHGIHDTGAEDVFVQANRNGWVTEALAIGSNPADQSGRRFTQWIDGIGVVCRIAHLYGQILPDPGPAPQYPGLDAFAQRAANFVRSSVGCGIWSIGNEPHLEGAQDPAVYAEAFVRVYRAIKAVRPAAKVITAGFVHGDMNYFNAALQGIEGRGVLPDGIALHTYTDSQGWNETSFRDYQLKIANLPASMRQLPLYITEAGAGAPGNPAANTGLVNAMFNHVHQWNASGGQQVRAVCFYRWTAGADKWSIEDNAGMRADFVGSLANDYRWFPGSPGNQAPTVSLSTDRTTASAPGSFVLTASASDPDGSISRIEFYQGQTLLATDTASPYSYTWSGIGAGSYTLTAKAFDNAGASALSNAASVTVNGTPPTGNLVSNGDFANGLSSWSVWGDRGALNQGVNGQGQLHLQSPNHNGGVYQTFSTGGPARRIAVAGSWGSSPTQPDYQWAEVLVINGPDLPVQGQDIVAGQQVGQSSVVLIYKNDTWRSRSGWSGVMSQTAAVANVGAFTAAGNSATIVLKSGNGGPTKVSGTWFDAIEARVQ